MTTRARNVHTCTRQTHAAHAQVWVRARVQAIRGKGKTAFIVLRQRLATVQARARVVAAGVMPSGPASQRGGSSALQAHEGDTLTSA